MISEKICIIGLGYVGLPLFSAFNKKNFNVCGFDIDNKRIEQLKRKIDVNNEILKKDLKLKKKIILPPKKKILKIVRFTFLHFQHQLIIRKSLI